MTAIEVTAEDKLTRALAKLEASRLTDAQKTTAVQLTYWEMDALLRALRFGAAVRDFVKP